MLMQIVDSYLSVRRATGFTLKDDEQYLHSYARYADDRGDIRILSKTPITWAEMSSSEAQRAIRLKSVIRLARYCKAEDGAHEVPPEDIFCSRRHRPLPYIYTNMEIEELMKQALKLEPHETIRPLMYYTLIGLLASTGLRISEALKLEFGDISDNGLLIRNSKYRKSRLIPLHRSTMDALNKYLTKRRSISVTDGHLFVSQNNRSLGLQSVYTVFHRLLDQAGIPSHSVKKRPRLIDFRHTFATKALMKCANNRDHISQHLLALSTYLGHAHVGCTYWYLENTPDLMRDIADKCVSFVEEKLL